MGFLVHLRTNVVYRLYKEVIEPFAKLWGHENLNQNVCSAIMHISCVAKAVMCEKRWL